jgi:alanyl-tRNA synthetase
MQQLASTARIFKTTTDDLPEKVRETISELEKERKLTLSLERELAWKDAESKLSKVDDTKGFKVFSEHIPPVDQQTLRDVSDMIKDKLGSAVVVLGTIWQDKPFFVVNVSSDLAAKGVNAVALARPAAKVLGGGGGGRADFAQGSGKDKSKLDEALRLVKDLI